MAWAAPLFPSRHSNSHSACCLHARIAGYPFQGSADRPQFRRMSGRTPANPASVCCAITWPTTTGVAPAPPWSATAIRDMQFAANLGVRGLRIGLTLPAGWRLRTNCGCAAHREDRAQHQRNPHHGPRGSGQGIRAAHFHRHGLFRSYAGTNRQARRVSRWS